MSFSENLKEALDFRGMQIKELSAKTGISKNTIDNYLSGQKSLPNVENGVKIAKTLGVTVEYLVTRTNPTSVSEQQTIPPHQSLPLTQQGSELFHDLQHLKKSDFDAIRAIVKSLAGR